MYNIYRINGLAFHIGINIIYVHSNTGNTL